MDILKRCSFCYNHLPATTEYFPQGHGKDGLRIRCKDCIDLTRSPNQAKSQRRKHATKEQRARDRGKTTWERRKILSVEERRISRSKPIYVDGVFVKYAAYPETRRLANVQLMRDIKMSKGCKDCGYRENYAGLEFDHIPGLGKKLGTVSNLARFASAEIMLAEIEKCEVVCAICHRIRTVRRRMAI